MTRTHSPVVTALLLAVCGFGCEDFAASGVLAPRDVTIGGLSDVAGDTDQVAADVTTDSSPTVDAPVPIIPAWSIPRCEGPDGPVAVGDPLPNCQVCGLEGTPVACRTWCEGDRCVSVDAIDGGGQHTCARFRVDGLGEVAEKHRHWCWGRNYEAQIGNGQYKVGPAPPTPLSWAGDGALSAGYRHTCVLLGSEPACFGLNRHGQAGGLGDGDYALLVSVDLAATRLAAGTRSTCAIVDDGAVSCWGYVLDGQQLTGSGAAYSVVPTALPGFGPARPARLLAVGDLSGCAIVDEVVWCFGAGPYGELGAGEVETAAEPVSTAALPDADSATHLDQLEMGRSHVCVRSAEGKVWCWGRNAEQQLGDGPPEQRVPVRVAMDEPVVDIALGAFHTCLLGQSGAVECRGLKVDGVLGPAVEPGPGSDRAVIADLRAREITSGDRHVCAVEFDGNVVCWGTDTDGQLGTSFGGPAAVSVPSRVYFIPSD